MEGLLDGVTEEEYFSAEDYSQLAGAVNDAAEAIQLKVLFMKKALKDLQESSPRRAYRISVNGSLEAVVITDINHPDNYLAYSSLSGGNAFITASDVIYNSFERNAGDYMRELFLKGGLRYLREITLIKHTASDWKEAVIPFDKIDA